MAAFENKKQLNMYPRIKLIFLTLLTILDFCNYLLLLLIETHFAFFLENSLHVAYKSLNMK